MSNPDRFYETNVILGKHPTRAATNVYFGSCIAANTALYPLLPESHRTVWYGLLTAFEAAVITHNVQLGLSF